MRPMQDFERLSERPLSARERVGGGYGWRPKQLTCEVPKSAPERSRVGKQAGLDGGGSRSGDKRKWGSKSNAEMRGGRRDKGNPKSTRISPPLVLLQQNGNSQKI